MSLWNIWYWCAPLALRTAYELLVNSIQALRQPDVTLATSIESSTLPTFSEKPPIDVKLLRSKHPKIKFWTKDDWIKHKEKKGSVLKFTDTFESTPSRGIEFLETEDGSTVTKARANIFRERARSIWILIGNKRPESLPSSWGKAALDIIKLFNQEMRLNFLEFSLCKEDWKAKAFAIEYYPSWYKPYKAEVTIKQEERSQSPPTSPPPKKSIKHALPLEVCKSRKKAKLNGAPKHKTCEDYSSPNLNAESSTVR